jgi:site-specific DNA-methyltransferase (adenine-specific)
MFQIMVGDVLKRLPELADGSVDACVCDPPYGISFMSMTWDGGDIAHNVNTWRECLRVLKPGGHLLAFGGSRTYHRLACAIEDAGFEVRDCCAWIFGSGFPKSLSVSKAIDKAAGVEREVTGKSNRGSGASPQKLENHATGDTGIGILDGSGKIFDVTVPATEAAKQWDGWGTALKPAMELIVVARKPLIGTVAANVLEYGTGALNIDGCRVEGGVAEMEWRSGASTQNHIYGSGIGIETTWIPSSRGRWPANVIHDGSDEVLSLFPETASGLMKQHIEGGTFNVWGKQYPRDVETIGDTGSAARFFYEVKRDEAGGAVVDSHKELSISHPSHKNKDVARMGHPAQDDAGFNARPGEPAGNRVYKDAGGTNFGLKPGARREEAETPARFFYCPKADKEEREQGLQGLQRDAGRKKGNPGGDNPRNPGVHERLNHHPTVKPLDLMAYLCRLVTPPGGTVLDCFMGSGSTGIAALREGFNFIGIEIDEKYAEIARRRIEGDCPLFNRKIE